MNVTTEMVMRAMERLNEITGANISATTMRYVLQEVISLSPQPEGGWISTATGNPRPLDGQRVLIWYRDNMDGPGVEIGRYLHVLNEWRPVGGVGDFSDRITHWMPLPANPPSQEKC